MQEISASEQQTSSPMVKRLENIKWGCLTSVNLRGLRKEVMCHEPSNSRVILSQPSYVSGVGSGVLVGGGGCVGGGGG
jgi:hypothetical protein